MSQIAQQEQTTQHPEVIERKTPDAIDAEKCKKIRSELLAFLEIPTTIPEDPLSKRDHPRKKSEQDREKSIRGSLKELGKEDPRWAKANVNGIRLLMGLTQHSMDIPRVVGAPGERFLNSTWTRSSRSDTISTTFHPTTGADRIDVSLNARDVVTASNKFAYYDEKPVERLMSQIIDIPMLTATAKIDRMGGMRSFGAPAAMHYVTVNAPLGNREEMYRFYQAFAIARETDEAVRRQVERQSTLVTTVDKGRNAAYPPEYGGDKFLYEHVRDVTVEAIVAYLGKHPNLIGSISDVNALIKHDRLIPTITVRKAATFFGRPVEDLNVIELDAIALEHPVDDLLIKELCYRKTRSTAGAYKTLTHHVQLPPGYEIEITAQFYTTDGETTYGEFTKSELIEELRMRLPSIFERQEPRVEKDIPRKTEILKSLLELGLSIDDLKNLDTADQVENIKQAYRTLARQFHPDHNPDNKQAEERTKDITAAFRLLMKEGGFEAIDLL